jgi:hypothetical protein
MRKLQEGSLYIAIALYFLCIAAGGIRPALLSGGLGPSKMPGRPYSRVRLSLNYYTGPPTKHQKGKRTGVTPARKKIKKKKKKEKEKRSGSVVVGRQGVFCYLVSWVKGLGVRG